jgi:hypothetical protein
LSDGIILLDSILDPQTVMSELLMSSLKEETTPEVKETKQVEEFSWVIEKNLEEFSWVKNMKSELDAEIVKKPSKSLFKFTIFRCG